MPVSFLLDPHRRPLFFVDFDFQKFETVTESPEEELNRRVCDRFLRRVTTPDVKPFAQSVLDEMMREDDAYPGYGTATVRTGWWIKLPYPFGRQWVDYCDAHRFIEIQWGPPLQTWRDRHDGRWRRSGQPPHRFNPRDYIDRTSLQIEVQLDPALVEWFRTPREHTIPVRR